MSPLTASTPRVPALEPKPLLWLSPTVSFLSSSLDRKLLEEEGLCLTHFATQGLAQC